MAKCQRDCSAFSVRREGRRTILVGRDDADPALAAVIRDPERALAEAVLLKQGNTATVGLVGALVVKRYNVKNRRHAWRLRTRPSRARRAWRVGHALRLVGLPAARPRALIECRGKSPGGAAAYLVHDRVAGEPLAAGACPDAATRAALCAMLEAWRRLRLSHGDAKASNLLLADGAIHVLDLDAAALHRARWRFARRHRRDRARLRRNWPEGAPP